MLRPVVRYVEDAAGLEKSLRLLQGLCTVALGLADDPAPFVVARTQLNVGRRYFRLLKWHPCWMKAYASLTGSPSGTTLMILEVVKWSFLGMYFFLEAFTITNAMGATSFDWAPRVQQEANKCWFYALSVSNLLSLLQLSLAKQSSPSAADQDSSASPEKRETQVKEAKGLKKSSPQQKASAVVTRTAICTQLAVDSCDLLIPGSALGWISAGPVVVGTAITISSLLAGQQIWQRVQQHG